MKAIILAAGEGRRLRPLTESTPKCLLPLDGKPLLEYWLENCERCGFTEVLINGHYLAEQIEEYLSLAKKRFSLKIHYVHEEKLVGTGGTVKNNSDFIQNEPYFLFCHGDNFTNIDLKAFKRFHDSKDTDLSVALFRTNVPKQCGIAEEIDSEGRIIRFVEKPQNPASDLASAAIFLMSPKLLQSFPDKEEIDFSKEVLPKFQGEMYGFPINGFNLDIGTPDNYRQANDLAIKTNSQNTAKN